MPHTKKINPGNAHKRCEMCGGRKANTKEALCDGCLDKVGLLNNHWKPVKRENA